MKTLEEGNFVGKKVLLRIDADLPLTSDRPLQISDDYRLRMLLPTLNYLLNRQSRIVLMGHLGRPGGAVKSELSLRPVFLRLSALLKKPVQFAPSLFSPVTTAAVGNLKEGEVLGLENLRFDPGEDNNSRTFAKRLSEYGEVYVNEAFAAHHVSASTVAITEFLPPFAGFRLEQEYNTLTQLSHHPAHPFVAVIGGAKTEDKLPVIKGLLPRVDWVLLGGRVANNLLLAAGVEIKESVINPAVGKEAREIVKRGRGKIILPNDFVWKDNQIFDIGPETIKKFCLHLHGARTVLWCGPLGKVEEEKFARGSLLVAKCIVDSGATSIIGGGDTTGFLANHNLTERFSFISTGGGATLALLAGNSLPGVKALG